MPDDIECGDCMDTGIDPDTDRECTGTCARMNENFDPHERHDVEYRAWLASGLPRATF